MTTSAPIVIGMDPSLSGFGISDGERHAVFSTSAGASPGTRARSLVDEVGAFVAHVDDRPMMWVIEAPLLHSAAGSGSHLYELGWLMCTLDAYARKLRDFGAELVWLEIATASLRKWLTGKGNAPKISIPMAVYKRFGVDFALSDPGADKAFAYALHQYGLAVSRGEIEHQFAAPRGQGQRSRAAVRKAARARGAA